jgi:hypothetical protein
MWQRSMILLIRLELGVCGLRRFFRNVPNPNPGELMDNEEFDNHQITKSVSVLCHHPNVASASPE